MKSVKSRKHHNFRGVAFSVTMWTQHETSKKYTQGLQSQIGVQALFFLLYILRVLKDTFGKEVNSTKECASLSPFYIRCTQIILCHLHSLPIVYSQTLSRALSLSHTHTHLLTNTFTHTHSLSHTHTHKHSSDTPLHSILHTYANTFTHLCTHLNVYQLAWFVAILAWDYQNTLYPVYSLDLNIWSGKKRNAQIRTKTGFKADQPDFSLNSVINQSKIKTSHWGT